jgi:diadenylate cyclase
VPLPERPDRTDGTDVRLRTTLSSVAPGTELREGLERILRGNTGALIVYGWDRSVESLCSGGFVLDVEFTATRLRELAKMDGAVVVDPVHSRIVRAAVHLVPDASISTVESGTRHRTAQRVARQTGVPVISVSQSMRIIAIYLDAQRYVLDAPAQVLSRANQALATLERYKVRLDQVTATLSALEIEDLATVRDVATVAQRLEMVRRIADEVGGYVVELGSDGRLVALQLEELLGGADTDRALLIKDYAPGDIGEDGVRSHLAELDALEGTDLVAFPSITRALQLPEQLEASVSPRGDRLLAKLPRIPVVVLDRLVEHFGGLQKLLSAGVEELQEVEGVGELRARTVREGLSRLAETSFVDRYV